MKLSFLGKSYTASTPPIDAVATGETATFMGRSYVRKQFSVAQRHQPAALTYRGVRYRPVEPSFLEIIIFPPNQPQLCPASPMSVGLFVGWHPAEFNQNHLEIS